MLCAGCGDGDDGEGDGDDGDGEPDAAQTDVVEPDVSVPDVGDPDGGEGEGDVDEEDGGGEEFVAFDDSCTTTTGPGDDAEETTDNLLTAFVGAEEGSVICMVDGTYMVNEELSINPNNVTLLGESQEGTVLDFAPQETGANGIQAQVQENFAARNFTIKNTAGDALRAQQTDGVVMKNLTVTWDAGVSEENGAYALYPVQAENVLVEGCEVSYARDAGVYLGQSDTAILRDNVAYGNVVGIEVENTFRAEVYDNEAYDNTDGFLIINLPDLEVKGGGGHLIYDNVIEDNNEENFGESGTAVSNMPQGTGMLVATANDSEIRDNTITGHMSVGIGVVTYNLIETTDDEEYDPFPEGNWIHDNTLSDNGSDPQGAAQIAMQEDGTAPQIFWDGKFNSDEDNSDGSLTNCFGGNSTPEGDPVEMTVLESTSECPDSTDDPTAAFCENDCSGSEVDPVELPERVMQMAE